MYKITAESSFSAAHRLPDHQGKCRNLHGHNWLVQAVVGAETLDDQGMVVDFAVLKQALGELCDRFDHRMVNEIAPFDRIPPTAENFAKLFFDELVRVVGTNRVQVLAVRLWETDRNVAEYSI
ncbi:MAG TPA: 6-carboxytetrahydropterin synthase QueD [Candidatus Ozemobacteraceae bacterium]|nr:6-carboxytetrahydropterin synthase QueD [Candidatus Ozemobacteraceae bacterium]